MHCDCFVMNENVVYIIKCTQQMLEKQLVDMIDVYRNYYRVFKLYNNSCMKNATISEKYNYFRKKDDY